MACSNTVITYQQSGETLSNGDTKHLMMTFRSEAASAEISVVQCTCAPPTRWEALTCSSGFLAVILRHNITKRGEFAVLGLYFTHTHTHLAVQSDYIPMLDQRAGGPRLYQVHAAPHTERGKQKSPSIYAEQRNQSLNEY